MAFTPGQRVGGNGCIKFLVHRVLDVPETLNKAFCYMCPCIHVYTDGYKHTCVYKHEPETELFKAMAPLACQGEKGKRRDPGKNNFAK